MVNKTFKLHHNWSNVILKKNMKKLLFITCLFILAVSLSAVPPSPGASHGGCFHHSMDIAPFRSPSRYNSDSSVQKVSPPPTSTSGDRNILVIMVEFTDKKFDSSRRNKDVYETLLGKESESAGSMTMRKYYQDMSGGQLNLTFTVLGPYDLGQPIKHYGENVDGVPFDDIRDGDIVTDAIKKAKDLGHLDSPWAAQAANWDSDNDGTIDFVAIVHAGIDEQDSLDPDDLYTCKWSLEAAQIYGRSTLGKYEVTINGIKKFFNRFIILPEYTIKGVPGPSIGAFCHEYGHLLGLPDLYDYTYETDGVGFWSLMSFGSNIILDNSNAGGSAPAPLLAWEKYYLGWLTPETINPTAEPQTFYFSDIEKSRKAWKINLNSSGSQYLILEGKKQNITGTGWTVWEDGLLITHIDESILETYWDNHAINDTKTRVHGIDVVESQSPYYESTGLGSLWNDPGLISGIVCFRNNTKHILVPSYPKAAAGIGILACFMLLYKKRKKLAILLLICCIACFIACSLEGHSSHSDKRGQDIPNTNYYTSDKITSKTGISGVIITVDCPAGSSSGSFTVKKEE